MHKIQPERNLSYSPLFQVMLNWRDRDQLLSFIGLEGLVIESLMAESRTSKFDLTLFATDCGNEIWLEMEYSTDLFEDARIARMLGHFQTLLESVVANPDEYLSELPLLTLAERRLMLEEWNRTELSYPRERLLHELIEEQVDRTPDAVAAVFEDRRVTYRQLNTRANRIAHHLRSLGVGPNVLVAVCLERSLDMLASLLGILKAGGAYVPLDPAYPKTRLDFILEDAHVSVVLAQERLRQLLTECKSLVVYVDSDRQLLSGAEITNLSSTAGPNDLAYVIYTSGSTGQPKGVAISHQSPVAFVHWAKSVFSQQEMSAVLCSTSICFDLSVFEIFATLAYGGKVILVENALHLRELPAANEVTLINTVPSVMKELIGLGELPPSVCTINLAGEPLSAELVQRLYGLPAVRKVYDLYGPSETTTYSTFILREPDGPSTIGRPIANTQIYILDSSLQPVPVGVVGELCIAGVGLAAGYLNRPELTAKKFVEHPFSQETGARLYRTGDLARYLADGNIEFLGRMDQQVKVRGFRIELGEIEARLKKHPEIDQCVVVAHENSYGDKNLVAHIVPSRTQSTLETSELKIFIKQELPEYMVPMMFAIVEHFPITPNGKIDRKALTTAQYLTSEPEVQPTSAPPQTPLEVHLQKIWERLLGVNNINIDDNFFNLGGHSLMAVRLISEINKSLNVSLPAQIFFLNPTIEELARVLLDGKHAKPGPHLIPLGETRSPGAIYFLEAPLGVCQMAQHLDVGLSLFATQVPIPEALYRAAILNEKSGAPSIEEMAAPHVALIRSQNISGPCLLAGHSFYGLLAFEVAHQLRREGINVEMLLVLDTLLMLPPLWYRLRVLTWARLRAAVKRRFRLIAVKVRKLLFPSAGVECALDSTFAQADRLMFEVPFELLKGTLDQSRDNYTLRTLESRAILFLAQAEDQRYARSGQTFANIKKVSRLFAGGFETVETPGTHLTMLADPHVQVLAQKINECLVKYSSSSASTCHSERLDSYEEQEALVQRAHSSV